MFLIGGTAVFLMPSIVKSAKIGGGECLCAIMRWTDGSGQNTASRLILGFPAGKVLAGLNKNKKMGESPVK